MKVFESELKNGRFLIGECTNCNKITWPPGEFCSICFGDLTWRRIKEPGILIEFSSKDGQLFGIVEFEDQVRVIGTISDGSKLEPGQKISISRCGFVERPQFAFTAE